MDAADRGLDRGAGAVFGGQRSATRVPSRLARRAALLLAGAATLLVLGCGGGDGDGNDSAAFADLSLVSGANQTQVVATALAQPLTVRLSDAAGRPVAGQGVGFVVVSGGGTVFAGTAVSDANGHASERWTLGTLAGIQRLEARSVTPDGSARVLSIEATALAAAPVALSLVGSVGAAAQTQPLPDPVRIRVLDAYGNACAGVVVGFAAQDGGSASPMSAVTAVDGDAETHWTLGPVIGPQTLRVTAAAAVLELQSFATAAAPSRPAQLVKMLGDFQQSLQHTEMGVQVKVLDILGNPVPQAAVRFDVPTLAGYFAPRFVVSDAQGLATWFDAVHSAGVQTIIATIDGDPAVPSAAFTLDVTPTGGPFDGRYDFNVVLSDPNSTRPRAFDRVLSNSTWPEYSRPVDLATGLTRIAIRLSLDAYFELDGQLVTDAAGRVTGAGTLIETFAGTPTGLTGSWQAVRR